MLIKYSVHISIDHVSARRTSEQCSSLKFIIKSKQQNKGGKNEEKILTISGILTITIFSCGGGGGSQLSTDSEKLSGKFIDAPVAGLVYKDVNAQGKVLLQGKTNEKGEFKFLPNSKVEFYLDENATIKLGTIDANSTGRIITPLNISDNIFNGLVIAALIQSLEEDDNSTYIKISSNKVMELKKEGIENINQNIKQIKEMLEKNLDEGASQFAKWNLFGLYKTEPSLTETTLENSTSGTYAEFIFDGSNGGGYIAKISDNDLNIQFYKLEITDYNYTNGEINIKIVGSNLITKSKVKGEVSFKPEDNQKITLTIEDTKQTTINLYRKAYPKPSYCESINMTGNYYYNASASVEKIKCFPNNNSINLENCLYNQPETDNDTSVTFENYSRILPNNLQNCTVSLVNTGKEEQIVGLVLSNSTFSTIFNDQIENNGNSPNYFTCELQSNKIVCNNIYVNVNSSGEIEKFVIEKVQFDQE